MVEVGLEVEDEAGVDACRRGRRRAARGCRRRAGAGPPRQPMLRKKMSGNGISTPCGTPTMPTVEPGRAIANAVVDRLRGADALQRGVDADAVGELAGRRRSASSPRASTMSVAPNVRASCWRAGLRLRAMIRSAPRRSDGEHGGEADGAVADDGDRVARLDAGADGGVVAGRHDVGQGQQRPQHRVGVARSRGPGRGCCRRAGRGRLRPGRRRWCRCRSCRRRRR